MGALAASGGLRVPDTSVHRPAGHEACPARDARVADEVRAHLRAVSTTASFRVRNSALPFLLLLLPASFTRSPHHSPGSSLVSPDHHWLTLTVVPGQVAVVRLPWVRKDAARVRSREGVRPELYQYQRSRAAQQVHRREREVGACSAYKPCDRALTDGRTMRCGVGVRLWI